MGKKKKQKVFRDKHGEFKWEHYLIGGKQKKRKIRTIDGIPKDEFMEQHADEITLLKEERFDLLHRKQKMSEAQSGSRGR